MKKGIALVLTALLLFALGACGGKDTGAGDGADVSSAANAAEPAQENNAGAQENNTQENNAPETNTPEDALQLYWEAFFEGSEEKLQRAVSAYAWETDYNDKLDYLQAKKAEYAEEYGENATISVRIRDEETVSYTGGELKDQLSYFDTDAYGITELRTVAYFITVNGREISEDADLVLENGVWKVLFE